MRTLAVATITGFVALLVAGSAGAGPTVDLVWTGTTGAGTIGGGTIDALPGDVLTMDIVVNDEGGGLTLAALSLSWAAGSLTAQNVLQCPSPPNLVPGTCFDPAFGSYSNLSGVPVPDNGAGFVGIFDPSRVTPSATGFSLTIGRVDFVVNGAGMLTVALDYSSGVEGITDNLFARTTPAASGGMVNVIPEPATAGLLALGLGALAIIGRRRA